MSAATVLAAQPQPAAALDFNPVRDPVEAYYALLAIGGILFLVQRAGAAVIEDAKSYDERGSMANAMLEEKRKRDRAAARDEVRKSEPEVYNRMQAEKKQRTDKKGGWKFFPADDDE